MTPLPEESLAQLLQLVLGGREVAALPLCQSKSSYQVRRAAELCALLFCMRGAVVDVVFTVVATGAEQAWKIKGSPANMSAKVVVDGRELVEVEAADCDDVPLPQRRQGYKLKPVEIRAERTSEAFRQSDSAADVAESWERAVALSSRETHADFVRLVQLHKPGYVYDPDTAAADLAPFSYVDDEFFNSVQWPAPPAEQQHEQQHEQQDEEAEAAKDEEAEAADYGFLEARASVAKRVRETPFGEGARSRFATALMRYKRARAEQGAE